MNFWGRVGARRIFVGMKKTMKMHVEDINFVSFIA